MGEGCRALPGSAENGKPPLPGKSVNGFLDSAFYSPVYLIHVILVVFPPLLDKNRRKDFRPYLGWKRNMERRYLEEYSEGRA